MSRARIYPGPYQRPVGNTRGDVEYEAWLRQLPKRTGDERGQANNSRRVNLPGGGFIEVDLPAEQRAGEFLQVAKPVGRDVLVFPAYQRRRYLLVQNNSDDVVYLGLGLKANASNGIRLAANGGFYETVGEYCCTNEIYIRGTGSGPIVGVQG